MVRKDLKERRWNAKMDGLRTGRSQKFIGAHEKDTRSPRFKSRKSDAGSSASEKGSPVSPRERSNTIGERGGVSAIQRNGISNRDRGNTFSYGTEDEYKDVPIKSFKDKNANRGTSDDNAEAKETRKQITSRNGDETKADRYRAPLASPYTIPSKAKAELAREGAVHEEAYDVQKDEGMIRVRDFGSFTPPNKQETHHDPRPQSPEPNHSIDETSDRENQAVSDLSQEPEETETLPKTPPFFHGKERDSLDSPLKQSGSGPILVDAAPIHDPVEEPVDLGINVDDEAPDVTRSADSTENVDAPPIHDPIEEQVDQDVDVNDNAPDSTHSPDTMENVDTRPIHNSAEEQVDPGIAMDEEAPDGTHRPDTTEYTDQDVQLMSGNGEVSFSRPKFTGSSHVRSPISQLGSPGIGHFEKARSQPSPARNDRIESPDAQLRYLGHGRVAVETSPTQDEVVAWLNSPSSLPDEYYKFYPGNPIPPGPALSSSPGSHAESIGTGSLIVSSDSPDEQETEEEESPWDSRAKTELLARYRDNFPLRPPTEDSEAVDERGAEAATDRQNGTSRRRISWISSISTKSSGRSLLLSPGRGGDESPTNGENAQDDAEKAKEAEEEADKAKINLLEVYKANFDLQTKLELNEANFKREIQQAWKHPRPPPTTSEQRADKRALEKIESMKIFDEVGDQQRPIRTNPQMVVWETVIDIMITRARISYLLEDFPKMYMHANHAVAAASQLRFPPLTALCCYYRGMASYHHREFPTAKTDFEASRDCAGLYGISSEIIEKHIDLIDSADDPGTVVLERFPAPRSKSIVHRAKRTAIIPDVDNESEPSHSPADDATTLVEGSPRSPQDTALPPSPSTSPNDEEGSVGQTREDTSSHIGTLRRSSPVSAVGEFTLDDESQFGTNTDDDVPNYKPREEAISEEIRKNIFESKAQSLDPLNEAGPAVANAQEEKFLSPRSMASTEWTLLGSATSRGTTRRVPRPHIAPIDTSLAKATRSAVREVSAEATTGEGSSVEMGEDEIMEAFNTRREDATPDTGNDQMYERNEDGELEMFIQHDGQINL